MADAIVVLNAGSSSIKFSLFVARRAELELELHGQVESVYTTPHFIAKRHDGATAAEKFWAEGSKLGHDGALDHLVAFLRAELADDHLIGVGHRVLHGGLVPDLPQVACFDTSFHSTNPDLARRFALPEELHEAGIRRYGFHGLSYEYIASVLADFDANAARGRVVVLHLGNGSSLCAIKAGQSVATTMGFTALEGLAMGTPVGLARSGRDLVPDESARNGCTRH
jgi:acetate kinase